jgi:hypothetical protein
LRKLRCRATLRNASTPSSAPCLTVKFCFIAHQHYPEWLLADSGITSALQIGSTADVEPNIRDITAISKNKGYRRDPSNETDESNP